MVAVNFAPIEFRRKLPGTDALAGRDQSCRAGKHSKKPLRADMLPQNPQIQIPIPFAEPASVRGKEHGNVEIGGMGETEQLLQVHLPGSRAQKVGAPNHLGNAGLAVIHGDGKLIDIHAVCPAHHKITAVPEQIFPVASLHPVNSRSGTRTRQAGSRGKAARCAAVRSRQVPGYT